MAADNSNERNIFSDEEEEELLEERAFSDWRNDRRGGIVGELMGNPIIWGCAAAAVLIVLLVVLWPKSGDKELAGRITGLGQKIEMLENRIFILESSFENAAITDKPDDRPFKALEKRIEQLEIAAAQRTTRVNAALEMLGKKMSALESEKAAGGKTSGSEESAATSPAPRPAPAAEPAAEPAPKPAAAAGRSPSPPPAKAETARYHVVEKGDTLYSIARANGLSVGKLREINDLSPSKPIVPGQKLKISP